MFPNLRLLFLRFFIVVQVINYPSFFIVYCKIKQRKKRRISLCRRSHGWDWMQPRPQGLRHSKWRPTRHFDRREDPRDEVGTGWYMNLVTNHSKPTSIGQKHSHCLANYSNSVVIGYSGRKLPWKLLTMVYKGKPLPRSPFVCCC